mgnify:FL=1
MKVIAATKNKGKIREMQEILFIYAEIKTMSSCKIKNAKNCNLSIYSFSHFLLCIFYLSSVFVRFFLLKILTILNYY